jgi:hypothetical protein
MEGSRTERGELCPTFVLPLVIHSRDRWQDTGRRPRRSSRRTRHCVRQGFVCECLPMRKVGC